MTRAHIPRIPRRARRRMAQRGALALRAVCAICAICALCTMCALWSGAAAAHPLAPSLLSISAQPDGSAEILFRTPAAVQRGAQLAALLPNSCTPRTAAPQIEGAAAVARWQVQCDANAWHGARIGIAGLRESGTNGLVRLQIGGALRLQAVVHAAQPMAQAPRARHWRETAADYGALGLRHIAGGLDHLLFAAGLLLLLRSPRRVVLALSAFTLGHSITLALAALRIAAAPSALIEPAIAASLVWLGFEAVRANANNANGANGAAAGAARRAGRWAGGFGLLHGFGFAAALSEAGLPAGDIPLALASFNIGIELGQLAFVAAVGVAAFGLARAGLRPAWGPRAAAYAIGSLGFYWLLERIFQTA
ncbi:MAG: HupE/UreJ family protein [Deltaproteobacteria bacterium]|nr:HupE/UreJ family protein [Deltaproteobacteria bacterium]